MASNRATDLIASLLPEWHALIQGWAADGSLMAAAHAALRLKGTPEALEELAAQWTRGDFSALPPISLVSSATTMPAAPGGLAAHGEDNDTFYLDADWLLGAGQGSVLTQLTEQLGHHLDGLLNRRNTLGDEGKQFAALLSGVAPTSFQQSEHSFSTELAVGWQNPDIVPMASAAALLPESERNKQQSTHRPTAYAANRLILKFKPGVASAQAAEIKSLFGAFKTQEIKLTGAQVWTLSGRMSVEEILTRYGKSPIFEYIEPDYILTKAATSQATFPNDPSFNQLWGLHNTGQSGGAVDADIDAPEAWDIQKGNPDLVIGVIDTGVDYNHPDLQGNIWINPGEIAGDGIDNDGNGYIDDVRGWDFAYNDNNPSDVDGHGTHVAGTIAAKGNNGSGMTGVAWNAKIMPLKFLNDSGSGNLSHAILAINYATAKGVKITNNSWGGGGYSQALHDAINTAGQAGSLFIAAAGNDGQNLDVSPDYPAAYNLANIISVASTTRTDSLSSFSNYGLTHVDLGAPGSDIYSLAPGGGYATLSGTSMASPHVAGAAALLWSQNPTWTAQQVKAALMNTGDPIAALAGKTVSGKRLNVHSALAAASLPTVSVSVSPGSAQEDGTPNLVYTFTRSNLNLSAPLTVNFGASGLANAAAVGSDPADYTVLTNASVTFNSSTKLGTVTFAAGATTATVDIDPISDTVTEIASETVILTVNSGTGYIAGSPATATGTIISEEVLPTFSNPNPISIPSSGSGTPFPSTINVTGLSGTINSLKVTLTGLSHTWPEDIDALLVGPTGAKSLLISDAGYDYDLNGVTLTFDPTASSFLPNNAQISNGSYKPTNFDTSDLFSAPAPVGPYGADFSVFNNTNPNGVWSLYVMDDTTNDYGTIAGGWSLLLDVNPGTPTVSASVSPSSVQEDGTTNLVYTFTRSNLNLSAPLTVNFGASGLANAAAVGSDPADYTVLTNASVTFNSSTKLGTVTFAAGATTATVEIDPISDTVTEIASETVILTVNSGTGYIAGSPATATGTIVSEEISLISIDELRFASTSAGQTLTVYAGDTGLERVTIGTGTAATPVHTATTALNINASAAPNGLEIRGNNGANTLTGTAFADVITGHNGNDTLRGGLGNDDLTGDDITGGAGADIFRFDSVLNGSTNVDRITDFTPTTSSTTSDRIQLENTGTGLFTAITATGTLASTAFISGGAFTTTAQRIRYDSATGNLFYDPDGSGGASSSILFATLNTGLALTNSQFVVT